MLYMFLSFIFCGIAIPCFEHGKTSLGVILMILSCLMPVIKDTLDKQTPPPPPFMIEPDPAVEAQFKSIMTKLDQLEASLARCSSLLDELSTPAQ